MSNPLHQRHGFAHARTRDRAVSLRRRRFNAMVVNDPCMRGHITAARKHVNNAGQIPENLRYPQAAISG
jgi:hypothetical protein